MQDLYGVIIKIMHISPLDGVDGRTGNVNLKKKVSGVLKHIITCIQKILIP